MKLISKRLLTAVVSLSMLFGCTAYLAAYDASAEETDLVGDIRWDFIDGNDGFAASKAIMIASGGVIKVIANTNDPNISQDGVNGGKGIDASKYKYFRVRMKSPVKDAKGECLIQLFAERAEEPRWNYYQADVSVATTDTAFSEYEIPLDTTEGKLSIKNWIDGNVYRGIRFDFANGDAAINKGVEIDYIVLSNKSMSTPNSLVNGVTVGDCDLTFDESKDYMESNLYADLYNSLSAEDVTVSAESGVKTSVKVTTFTDNKVIDVVAQNADSTITDSYRIVCKSVRRPAEPTSVDITKCEVSGKRVTIEGALSTEDKRAVTVIAHKKDTGYTASDLMYIGKLSTLEDGSFAKSFNIYDDETSARLENLEVIIDVDGEDAPVMTEVIYVNNTKLNESIEDIKKDSSMGMVEYMASDSAKVIYKGAGVWCDIYNDLSQDLKDKIDKAAEGYRAKLSAVNVAEIANGSIAAILSAEYNNEDFSEMTADFDSKISAIVVEDKAFSELDKDVQKRIITAMQTEYKDGFADKDKFIAGVRENMLLDIVNRSTYTSMKELLLRNTDILGDSLTSLDNLKDKSICDSAMKEVTETARKSGFKSSETLVKAVKDAIADAKEDAEKENSKTDSGHKGGGSSGGGSYRTDLTKPVSDDKDTKDDDTQNQDKTENEVFNDLSGFDWAKDAILNLYNKGIVNGVDEKTFAPERNVTREEFVKLMCEAFGFGKVSGDVNFVDVEKDSWYAPYVAGAVRYGIINGISDTNFGTGQNISREDMAVILYRGIKSAYNIKGSDSATLDSFKDKELISDYAKDAVALFYDEEIVKGNENGNFEPKNSATRAEASVIINRCIEKWVNK